MTLQYCKQTMSCLKIWWLKTSVIYCWTFIRVLVMSGFIGFYHVSYEIFKTLDLEHNMSCVPNNIISFGLYVLLDVSQTQWHLVLKGCGLKLLYKGITLVWFKRTMFLFLFNFFLFRRFDISEVLKICFFMFLSCSIQVCCRFLTSFSHVYLVLYNKFRHFFVHVSILWFL